ncbi:MAG: 16S rRNA (cytosine(1402)-N(4))-methyltransferase RsmH [Candidatus Syntrophosphaera sp.]|nr:16S rRNA (cytosine(1402)-N(4))-methyltransferase RsmH [Candidatus Syntrophosphaera sp.]
MRDYHIPVMLKQCIDFIAPKPGGIYVDATIGGGGHSLGLLESCPDIHLIGFDQDSEALLEAHKTLFPYQDRVELIQANFSRMRTELAFRQIKTVSGILFDLGVSSHQLETPERGFSFDLDSPLDMRMDQSSDLTAEIVLNELSQKALTRIFYDYGEELNASRIAGKIVKIREEKPFKTTGDLVKVIESVAGKGTKASLKTKARIFQALRIYVNQELEILEQALKDAINILEPGGRIVVLSYHSLEDRIVKNVFRSAAEGEEQTSEASFLNSTKKRKLQLLTRKPLQADDEEINNNPHSRSVKLRAAEKI